MKIRVNPNKFKRFYPVLILSIIILCLIFIGLSYFTKSVISYGKILSSKDWIILRNNGQIENILINNLNGTKSNYSISVFERGDAGKFSLLPEITIGKAIKSNDTVGLILSINLEQQIENLKGQIENTKSLLRANLTGEKTSVVSEAQKQIELAQQQADENKSLLSRREELYNKNLIPKEEYELSKNQSELSEINLSILKAHLETVKTGVKPSTANTFKTSINSYQNELAILEKKLSSNNIISPLDGIVRLSNSYDTLLIVSDTTEFITIIPVKLSDLNLINKKSVKITTQTSSEIILAEIIKIDNSVYSFAGEQYLNCIALIKSKDVTIIPGILVSCEIECRDMTLIEKMKKYFNIR